MTAHVEVTRQRPVHAAYGPFWSTHDYSGSGETHGVREGVEEEAKRGRWLREFPSVRILAVLRKEDARFAQIRRRTACSGTSRI